MLFLPCTFTIHTLIPHCSCSLTQTNGKPLNWELEVNEFFFAQTSIWVCMYVWLSRQFIIDGTPICQNLCLASQTSEGSPLHRFSVWIPTVQHPSFTVVTHSTFSSTNEKRKICGSAAAFYNTARINSTTISMIISMLRSIGKVIFIAFSTK